MKFDCNNGAQSLTSAETAGAQSSPGVRRTVLILRRIIIGRRKYARLLLLSSFVHALLSNLAIICLDILPQSPGGVATTDVVASCKLLWKFSRNYGADHMVIYQSFCPLCSEH